MARTWYLVGTTVFGDRFYAYCDTETCRRWEGGCKSGRPANCPHGVGDGWPPRASRAELDAPIQP